MNASDKSPFRVGKRTGSDRWQVKRAPGWRVVGQYFTLAECRDCIVSLGGDPATTPVACNQHPWPTLGQLLAEGKEPS